ncbi:unnamed protein product [Parnassius mnemosyne]|uniref:Metalloendopeptidase n=1 Tax=Parnassius mnemosyne TaxID=213953 RepID=A0AAV1MBR7_9NEOP
MGQELAHSEPGFDLTEEEIKKFKIWPQGIIPYFIDTFSFDKVLRDRIRNYLDLTNRVTGLRFMEVPRPPTDEKTRWVLFINRQGLLNCADHSIKDFTNEGAQKVVLGYDCLAFGGELTQAIMALLGVPPQHNSPDRDKYIKIKDENIIPEKKHLFVALKDNEWLFHDIPYDFASASHYNLYKHSKNGFATIELKEPTNILVGEGKGFSYSDLWKITMLYNYNVKKKANSIKASDCVKLFQPGANFSNYEPLVDDEIEPRSKPNKYLGKLPTLPGKPNVHKLPTLPGKPNVHKLPTLPGKPNVHKLPTLPGKPNVHKLPVLPSQPKNKNSGKKNDNDDDEEQEVGEDSKKEDSREDRNSDKEENISDEKFPKDLVNPTRKIWKTTKHLNKIFTKMMS